MKFFWIVVVLTASFATLSCADKNLSSHFPDPATISTWRGGMVDYPIAFEFNGQKIELRWTMKNAESGEVDNQEPFGRMMVPKFSHSAIVFYKPNGKPWFYHYKVWEYHYNPPSPDKLYLGSSIKLHIMSTMFENKRTLWHLWAPHLVPIKSYDGWSEIGSEEQFQAFTKKHFGLSTINRFWY